MDDLISRKALMSRFEKWQRDSEEDNDMETAEVFEDCICALQDAPAVDAEPVVHGRWIELHEENGHEVGTCSHCRHVRIVDNYCPNCGAKMDGGNDNGKAN